MRRSWEVPIHTNSPTSFFILDSQKPTFLPNLKHAPSATNFPFDTGFKKETWRSIVVTQPSKLVAENAARAQEASINDANAPP